MPLYDYQCEKCEAVFEVERAFGASGSVKCRACGSTRTTKIFNAAGIVFKGSGFYVTDSKSRGAEPSKPSESAPKDTGDSTDSKPAETPKSESKSEPKAENREKPTKTGTTT